MAKIDRLPRRYFAIAIILLSIALCASWVLGLPLEYDEIWTLENFADLDVWRIINDLALPNNHPLNTLFVKLWSGFVTVAQMIRLHSLVSGVIAVGLTGVLARGIFHSRRAGAWCMLFMALSAAVVGYASRARGYAPQLLFVLLFACGVVWGAPRLRKFVPRLLPEAAVIVGALGAVLAVSSAPIFLAATVLAALPLYRRRPVSWKLVTAVAVAAVLSGAYLVANYQALLAARQWGHELVSFADWTGFVGGMLASFVPYTLIPLIAVAAVTDRKSTAALVVFMVLSIASAAVFKAGPERVYLPLAAVVALLAGRGAQQLICVGRSSRIKALGPLFCLLALAAGGGGFVQLAPRWRVTDYWHWFEAASAEPESTLVVYSATEGYPLCWNNQPRIFADYRRRLAYAADERELVIFGPAGIVNGIDGAGAEKEMCLPVPGARCRIGRREAHRYTLRRIESPTPGTAVIVVVPPLPEANVNLISRQFVGKGIRILSLNAFFNRQVDAGQGVTLRSRLYFVFAPPATDWALVGASGGAVYVLGDPSVKAPL